MSNLFPDMLRTLEIPVKGMDCIECTQHVQHALCTLPGVAETQVYLSSEKAVVRYDPAQVDLRAFRKAIEGAGYTPLLPLHTVELKILGMNCAECSQHVQHVLAELRGVEEVRVYLASEKAVVHYNPTQSGLPAFQQAVEAAGYTVAPIKAAPENASTSLSPGSFTRSLLTLFALVFGSVLLVVIAGEWLGWMERITDLVPWYVGYALVLLAGSPIFLQVIRAALRRRVISHTLMSLGVVAALDESAHLGVTALGALTSYGRALLAGGESAALLAALLPEEVDQVVVQADLTAVAPGPLVRERARDLHLLADVESRGQATVYRFTASSVRRAFDAGWAAHRQANRRRDPDA